MSEIPRLKEGDKILVVDDENDSQLKSILANKITRNVTFLIGSTLKDTNEKYDAIIATAFQPETVSHQSLLASYFSLLRPGGQLYFYVSESRYGLTKQLEQNLLISGFIDYSFKDVEQFECLIGDSLLRSNFKDVKHDVMFVRCVKPNYEVGSSKKVSLADGSSNARVEVASVWKLDDEDDYIDTNDLLNEDDVKRPDPSSLKVCGTTGKRKACKDCSCGLAEELDAEKKKETSAVKSSCGSCYLGDAFRCASCPYLGMPAFKPGEKIQLNDQFLAPDI